MTTDAGLRMDVLNAAVAVVESQLRGRPRAAIILGSGLGQLADKIADPVCVPFAEIPGFATSTAAGHRGALVGGQFAGQPVIAMSGRLHRYEGHSDDVISFPVRVMHQLGAEVLIASNAGGGVNPRLCVGDIVILQDSIDGMRAPATRPHPLLWSNRSGVEVPSRRGGLYDETLADVALRCSREQDFTAYPGTYLATLGPNYETRAEYRMMRRMGVDVVGMSTVPEVLAARELGMRVLALSMVSNVARPDEFVIANHDEVLAAGRAAAAKMEMIVRDVLKSLVSGA